ncbi:MULTISPECIES: transglycosylase family protein [unclassified Streptomyces]|uniref:transglycosylase family protein n=1 Tax=unclassified Streptomyces TaxID=2593676 RepID=UPI0005A5FFFE|nr:MULTISPECIES: transglycosylase family protein [unclassified Streptomyces]ODA72063.1 Resuscitation-promoting factor RpfA precursor [Streptomyces sp. AVP053U2]
MLSGNGRHRRPRQAPALLVAAGVTGSAIAIPLLGAGAASAADGSTWDRVAECESGGSWSQNSGNGYYGGLQLTQEDWEAYGGLDYAPSADQASRGQQIAVAEKILADQGVGVWRACGLLGGLDQDAPALDVDTGVEGDSSGASGSERSATPSPSQSAGSSSDAKDAEGAENGQKKEAGADASPSPSASPSAQGDDSGKSGQKADASESADGEDSGSGRHRGASAEEEAREGRDAGSSGRHASRGGLGFTRSLDSSSPSSDSGSGSAGGSSAASDSLALGGGWLAQYGGGDEAEGAATPHLTLFG